MNLASEIVEITKNQTKTNGEEEMLLVIIDHVVIRISATSISYIIRQIIIIMASQRHPGSTSEVISDAFSTTTNL